MISASFTYDGGHATDRPFHKCVSAKLGEVFFTCAANSHSRVFCTTVVLFGELHVLTTAGGHSLKCHHYVIPRYTLS